jgi:hypothetical protein
MAITWENREQIKSALKTLERNMQDKVIKKALRSAIGPVRSQVKRAQPIRSGQIKTYPARIKGTFGYQSTGIPGMASVHPQKNNRLWFKTYSKTYGNPGTSYRSRRRQFSGTYAHSHPRIGYRRRQFTRHQTATHPNWKQAVSRQTKDEIESKFVESVAKQLEIDLGVKVRT